MAININAKTTGVGGLETSADNSGNINIQSGGSTVMSVTSSGVAVTGSFSQNGAVYSTQPSFRNLIINGDMRIAQRGTSATGVATSGYYTIDRWQTLFSGAGTFTVSQDTDVPSNQGFSNSLKLDCTTANSSLDATDFIFVIQKMEGQNLQHLKYGTSSAESLTVSFWIKSNLTGNYVCNLYSADNSQLISASYTVNTANTWEKKTITFSGDTTNVLDNDNNKSLELEFWFTGGSNFTSGTLNTSWTTFSNANRNVGGQTNLGSSTANYINITGVQLEVGSTATEFEHLPVDVELARCQRYYLHINLPNTARNFSGFAVNSGQCLWTSSFTYPMRVVPSLITSGTFSDYASISGTGTISSMSNLTIASTSGTQYFFINGTGMSGMSANSGYFFRATTNTFIAFSAEL